LKLNDDDDIPDNEKADTAAKSALNKPIIRIPIPYTDLKPITNKYIHGKTSWKQTWISQTQNKLYQIYLILAYFLAPLFVLTSTKGPNLI